MDASNNQLPAILNVATIPTISNMNIKTEVLDPITITNRQAVFMIPKTGILDGGSMVQLGVKAKSSNFFPLNTGIHGLIKSCFLKVGGKVIASNDDYAYYTTMTRQFETPEHRAYVDMVKSGACGDRWAQVENGRIGYRDLEATVNNNATLTSLTVPQFIKPTEDDATTPLFSVPLSTLIPMMRSRQLPLMAIKEHIYLEINFNQQLANAPGTITCVEATKNAESAVSVSLPNIKFISDHLYYTNDQMDAVVKQSLTEQGLEILFEDLITTFADVPVGSATAGSVTPQAVERQVAVSGRTVRNMLIQEKNLNENHVLLGQYLSRDLLIPSSYNFRINDQRVYDRNVEAPPRKYNELSMVMGKPLYVPNQMYSYNVDTDKQNLPLQSLNQNSVMIGKIEGHQLPDDANTSLTNDLRSTSHYIGYDATTTGFNALGNGARIGVKPVIINRVYNRQPNVAGPPQTSAQNVARQMRIFTGVERVMVLKNGEITLSA